MSENKKNLNMIIIGVLMLSTIGMTAVSGVFIYSNFQNKQNSEYFETNYEEAYQNYLDAQDDYSETLDNLQTTQEELSQAEVDLEVALLDLQNAEKLLQEALDDLQEAEDDLQEADDELQLMQDNTEFSGTFYGLSQFNFDYDSLPIHAYYEVTYSEYFFHRLTLEHPNHSSSSLFEVAQNIAGYCRPDSVSSIAEDIASAVNDPLDDECVIDGLLTFCQDRGAFESSIHYVSDGVDDFSKYPIETLAEGGGDCEDKSILFASLARALDYDVRICIIPGHAFVAVKLDSTPLYGSGEGWHITINDDNYYTCETTGYGWLIGDLPEDNRVSVYTYPVL